MHPIERLRFVARASGVDQAVLVREAAQALAAFRGDPQGLVTACRRVVERQPSAGALWWLCCRMLCAGDPMVEARRAADEIEADPTARELAHALPDEATLCILGWPEVVGDALVRRGDVVPLIVDVLDEGRGLSRRLSAIDATSASDIPVEVAMDVPVGGLGSAAAASDVVLIEAAAMGDTESLCVAGSLAAASVAAQSSAQVWLVVGTGRSLPEPIWDALLQRIGGPEPWLAELERVPVRLVDRVVGPTGLTSVAQLRAEVDAPVARELCPTR